MKTLIIPEIILLDAYKKALRYIKRNYQANLSDPSKSYLGQILGATNTLQRYTLLEQAKSVFITTENDPRHIEVNIFFHATRASLPTIHITNPSEIPSKDALNISEGFEEPIFDDAAGTYQSVFNRRFKAKYNIVITSDNTNEVLLIYHTMRSMTISLIEHLSLSGLENIRISGSDINLKSDIVPLNVVMKNISIEIEYDVSALKLKPIDFAQASDVIFEGTIIPSI